MEDGIPRCAVFCTAEIPQETFESFLKLSEACQLERLSQGNFDISKWFILMTSKDLSTIRHGMSSPVQPFTSPFTGQTIDEIVGWFKENISNSDAKGYEPFAFVIFDSETVQEELCTVVSLITDDPEIPYEKVRCDFTLAMSIINLVNVGKCLDDTGARCFKNSGVAMTKERYKIVSSGGMYLDGMEVKVDEDWRNFVIEWS